MTGQPQSEPIRRRHRIRRLRLVLVLLTAVALALVIAWRGLLPESPLTAPGALSERDKHEIASLCRRHTVHFAVDRLRRGEFGWFGRSAHVLFEQKIDRLIDNRDGTYRAYVVVYDKSAPDGFNPWMRHQLTRTNGHWIILRSY
jgi:hypothetical protein